MKGCGRGHLQINVAYQEVGDAKQAVLNRGTRKKTEDTGKKITELKKRTRTYGRDHGSIVEEPLVKMDMRNLVPAGKLFTY